MLVQVSPVARLVGKVLVDSAVFQTCSEGHPVFADLVHRGGCSDDGWESESMRSQAWTLIRARFCAPAQH